MSDDRTQTFQSGALANLLKGAGPVNGTASARPPNPGDGESTPAAEVRELVPTRRECVRVLLADDHSIFLAGLHAFFEGQPGINILASARNGEEAVALACEVQPDVALLDVTMPELDGIGATRRIRAQAANTRVLILSRHANAGTVHRAFQEGATGYLLKGSSPADLVRGIRALADHETFLCPKAASLLMANAYEGESAPGPACNFHSLSEREKQVLQRIADGSSSKEIAAALCLSVKTVETHRSRLMRKLDLHSIAALTKCAVREGIASLDG